MVCESFIHSYYHVAEEMSEVIKEDFEVVSKFNLDQVSVCYMLWNLRFVLIKSCWWSHDNKTKFVSICITDILEYESKSCKINQQMQAGSDWMKVNTMIYSGSN